jgi:hypothetical protein
VGKWDLFDSYDLEDHREAAHLCNTVCPLLEWCKQELRDALASANYKGYGPGGTWAGVFVDRTGVVTDPAAVERRPKRRVAECGTLSGYKRHLRLKEETCRKCRDEVSRSNAERKARQRAEREAS